MSKYLVQLAIAVDQLLNALIGGWADETLSSRAYRQQHKKHWLIAMKIFDRLFFFQSNHCMKAYQSELLRHQTFPIRTETAILCPFQNPQR